MNKRKMNVLGLVSLAFAVAACNPVASTSTVKVYKPEGSISCQSGSGESLSEMLKGLSKQGISVKSAHCGTDGLVRAAVCNIPTGKINVYEIDAADLSEARGIGFRKIESLKDFRPTSC